jgi:hypothetical protein
VPGTKKWIGFAPIALVTLVLAWITIAALRAKVGHAAATLDDSYIHFQYARAIAEGHPLRYQAGEPVSTGATSTLWPLLLAPFYAIGFKGHAILWPAWILSFVALAFLAHEARALTRPLAGEAAAAGAAGMVLAFGGFLWCAASGMEVVPFAWAIARSMRCASEWAEAGEDARDRGRFRELIALATVVSLLRPEGAVYAIAIAVVLAAHPRERSVRGRLPAVLALGVPVLLPVFLRVVSGSASTNTAAVKLLAGNPYYPGEALWNAIAANLRVLFGTLLNGEIWSAEFVPSGGGAVALLGLVAIGVLGARTQRTWRAALILLIAIGMLAPCTYVTFLWNRLRYLWPFATGWFIGLACLARLLGDGLARIHPRWRLATPVASGVLVGMFLTKLGGVIDDVAGSASGIERQHVALGRWADAELPANARIGVNDTGAIAYFGNRKTFDIVGLTTAGEGRYWVAGPGSRLEHYERMNASATDRARLPTHFIVYPEWLGCDAILGAPLHEAIVTDSTILGGQVMRVYEADWSALGSGERPWTAVTQPPLDVVDVADLESESEHGYALFGAREGEEVARTGFVPGTVVDATTHPVIDGGRTNRRFEHFVAHLDTPFAVKVIVRVEAPVAPARFTLRANDVDLGARDVVPGDWEEISFDIPAGTATKNTRIDLAIEPGAVVFHYFFFPITRPE